MFLSLSFISYKMTSSSQIFCKDYVNLRVKHYYVVLAEGKSQKNSCSYYHDYFYIIKEYYNKAKG